MDAYSNIFKSVCRVCLKQNDKANMKSLIDITSPDGLSCFGKAMLNFASVNIKSNDVFPTSMCNDCLNCLKQAIYFKLKCETSENQLKKLTYSCFSESEIKQKIVEYTMFQSYFTNEDLQGLNISDTTSTNDAKSQVFMPKITGKENLDIEITVSRDSFSDNYVDNSDCNETNSFFDKNPTPSNSKLMQEDGDIILARLEKLIGSYSNLSTMDLKRRLKKRTFNRHKKLARRRQNQRSAVTETESFDCKVCHRVLANKHSYDNHMQRHNGCRYVCEHCGKGFPVLTELQVHQVAVHGTGPYLQCRQCPYKAPRKFSLIEHERIHTGERPYTCEKCGLTFRRRFVWKKHLIYHSEKTVQCNLCPRKFYLRGEMLAHSNNVHERMYVYLCNKCGATYAKPATVRRHLTERHGVPREMQGKVIRINKGKADFPE